MKRENQQKFALEYGVDLDNLQVKPLTHEDNPVTKKEIFAIASKKQREQIIWYHKDGLTWQDLDPRLNRYGSVRYQFIKNSGHYLGKKLKVWKCWVENCEYFHTETKIYYLTFGKDKLQITSSTVRTDDILVIGQDGSVGGHVLSAHPDEGHKRLGKMGVKIS